MAVKGKAPPQPEPEPDPAPKVEAEPEPRRRRASIDERARLLQMTLDTLKELLHLFRYERFAHLLCGIVAFLLLIYSIAMLFAQNKLQVQEYFALFTSTGLLTASVARITFFFNRAFDLVERIIDGLSGRGGTV